MNRIVHSTVALTIVMLMTARAHAQKVIGDAAKELSDQISAAAVK